MNLCIPKSAVIEYYQFDTENPPHWMQEVINRGKKIQAFIDDTPVDDVRLVGQDGYVIKWDNIDILGRGETYYHAFTANEFHKKFSIINEDTFKPIEEDKNEGFFTVKDAIGETIKNEVLIC